MLREFVSRRPEFDEYLCTLPQFKTSGVTLEQFKKGLNKNPGALDKIISNALK